MDLKTVVDEKAKVTGWFEFIEGFEVELSYMSRPALQEINRKCTRTTYKKHQPMEEADSNLLNKEIAKYILNWRGLDKAVLERMFTLKEGAVMNGDVPCTSESKTFLLEKAYGFDDFIIRSLTELEGYRREKLDEEIKNSSALSQDG